MGHSIQTADGSTLKTPPHVGARLRATGGIETMMMFATTGRAQARAYNKPRPRWSEAAGAALGAT
ncbi:hypothetical protein KR767_01155 [Luteibacter anthropi]|uniref:hypothetical protein n=1 Tax=Luteibacter anthropi TaxID=564369 RepID=UPI00203319D1|nr:hypothetical protein [Luteibacter anthropi]URX62716.1 hypothetical protein KR767_01155 [Luteibacter anthropi]